MNSADGFFEVNLSELFADVALPFDVYFRNSDAARLVKVHPKDSVISRERHRRYRSKRIHFLWIPNEHRKHFEDYQKRWRVPSSAASLELLRAMMSAENFVQERESQLDACRVVHRMISTNCPQLPYGLAELWELAFLSPFPGHGLRVSTYASLFAMAFEHLNPGLLAEVSLAGLLHDIGKTQIPFELVSRSEDSMSAEEADTFETHVEAAEKIIAYEAPGIPERVRLLIAQHHERFDGSGYPEALESFGVDDMAQILASADILDDLANGAWDGKKRSLRDALEEFLRFERAPNFPQFFNPDIFSALKRWTQTLGTNP